jgi:hypothetical protein
MSILCCRNFIYFLGMEWTSLTQNSVSVPSQIAINSAFSSLLFLKHLPLKLYSINTQKYSMRCSLTIGDAKKFKKIAFLVLFKNRGRKKFKIAFLTGFPIDLAKLDK